jgi:hypothetical protein
MADHLDRYHYVTRSSSSILVASLIVCTAGLLRPELVEAALPMQNTTDPRHLDLDPIGNGLIVAPGGTLERTFADALNSAEDWYMEFLIGNPTANAVAFDMKLVWPGDSTQGPGLLQPGHAFVLKVEGPDVPETSPNWKYFFKNPTSVDLILDASVSEALSITSEPPTGSGFFTLAGEPADPSIDNRFTPGGDIGATFVSVGIVPEPAGLILAVMGGWIALLLRRRPLTTYRGFD